MTDEASALRAQIRPAAMELFASQGLRFTMQQVAERVHMSKKTIYAAYGSKEELLLDMVDGAFDAIHERKDELRNQPGTTVERIRRELVALPDELGAVELTYLDELDVQYPAVAARVRAQLEGGWEPTLALFAQAMDEGALRRVPLPLVRAMVSAAIEAFLAEDTLAGTGVSYAEALDYMVQILMEGLMVR